MKTTIKELRNFVKQMVQEAAKDGEVQKVYRDSFKRMISKLRLGSVKNTPPFSDRAADPKDSGPPGND
ncbi:MAG TPA: hypothetical protein DCM40_07185 [Maribacter sp.]|nr:hypothetical protein [Maribacter sp.]